MANAVSMSADDKKWKAEMDAQTLADASAIRTDKKRMGAARTAAKRMGKEQQVKATALKTIARPKKK